MNANYILMHLSSVSEGLTKLLQWMEVVAMSDRSVCLTISFPGRQEIVSGLN